MVTFCSTQEHGQTGFFRRVRASNRVRAKRGEPQGELVEHEDFGFGHQAPAHGHHLLFAAAQGAGLLTGPFLEAGKEFVNLVQVLIKGGPGPGEKAPISRFS